MVSAPGDAAAAPMTAGVRHTVGLALGAVLLTAPASTQERPDAGIQLGPRPFFLVNDMHEGPLKDKLPVVRQGPVPPLGLLDWASRRGAAVSRTHARVLRGRRTHGGRDCRVRRDLHGGFRAGVPTRAERSAYHHQHPRYATRIQVHDTVHTGDIRTETAGLADARPGRMPDERFRRWPSSRRFAARWMRSTRRRAHRRSFRGAQRASARTCMPAPRAVTC